MSGARVLTSQDLVARLLAPLSRVAAAAAASLDMAIDEDRDEIVLDTALPDDATAPWPMVEQRDAVTRTVGPSQSPREAGNALSETRPLLNGPMRVDPRPGAAAFKERETPHRAPPARQGRSAMGAAQDNSIAPANARPVPEPPDPRAWERLPASGRHGGGAPSQPGMPLTTRNGSPAIMWDEPDHSGTGLSAAHPPNAAPALSAPDIPLDPRDPLAAAPIAGATSPPDATARPPRPRPRDDAAEPGSVHNGHAGPYGTANPPPDEPFAGLIPLRPVPPADRAFKANLNSPSDLPRPDRPTPSPAMPQSDLRRQSARLATAMRPIFDRAADLTGAAEDDWPEDGTDPGDGGEGTPDLNFDVPAERRTPAVNNTFNVTVAMGDPTAPAADREMLRDAIAEILRDGARRQGLEF